MATEYLTTGARFSECKLYRYTLWREWDTKLPLIVWCGLNPSTADDTRDDPTIRREVAFSKAWGFGRYVKVNAYAFRATNPQFMLAAEDPIGPDNVETVIANAERAAMFVACWGANIDPRHSWTMTSRLRNCYGLTTYCLGLTKAMRPKHPLYLKSDTKPIRWIWTEAL